jgi:hypothetical protein
MYCPQCGQQQSEEVRYCSRCGLSLYEIALWMREDGELINPDGEQRQVSPRRRHIVGAAKVAFFSGILCPIGLFVGAVQKEPQWLAIPLVVFLGSLVWMIYCRLFMKGDEDYASQRRRPLSSADKTYLPPSQSSGTVLEAHRVNTAEMTQPPSITEYTTNLLKKN